MKNLILLACLFFLSVAHAETLTPTLTILPLQPQQYPLSFCGQYPNADACKQKEEHRPKCIDGILYHAANGDHSRVAVRTEDGTLTKCHDKE